MAIQDISTAKPRQKGLPKKGLRKREAPTAENIDADDEERGHATMEGGLDAKQVAYSYERHSQNLTCSEEIKHHDHDLAPEDVPDGAQISKAFNHFCSMVRDRVKGHKRPEPAMEYFTKGRYVLVTGESSYVDPYFYSCSPQAGGGITVIISNDGIPADDIVPPIPEEPEPGEPSDDEGEESSSDDSKKQEPEKKEQTKDDDRDKTKEQDKKSDDKHPDPKDAPGRPSDVPAPEPTPSEGQGGNHNNNNMQKPQGKNALKYSDKEERRHGMPFRESGQPGSVSYEKVEVMESIEKFSDDRIQTYEETALIVETTIEKTTKKKQGERSS